LFALSTPGRGYGFGFFDVFRVPSEIIFALITASKSYMSASIAFVFNVLFHCAASGLISRIKAEFSPMFCTNE